MDTHGLIILAGLHRFKRELQFRIFIHFNTLLSTFSVPLQSCFTIGYSLFCSSHQRRYMGHKRTIRPNAKRLSALFMARDKMDWATFSRKVKSCQRGFLGEPEENRPGRGDFHEFPSTCICKKPFNFSNFTSKENKYRNPTVLESRYRYLSNSSNLEQKSSQKLREGSLRDRHGSVIDETDPDNPLSD